MGADTTILAPHNLNLDSAKDIIEKVGKKLAIGTREEDGTCDWFMPARFFNNIENIDPWIQLGIPLLRQPDKKGELLFFRHLIEFNLKETAPVFNGRWRSTLSKISEYNKIAHIRRAEHPFHIALKSISEVANFLKITEVMIFSGDVQQELEDTLYESHLNTTDIVDRFKSEINFINVKDNSFNFDFSDYSNEGWKIFNETVFIFDPLKFRWINHYLRQNY